MSTCMLPGLCEETENVHMYAARAVRGDCENVHMYAARAVRGDCGRVYMYKKSWHWFPHFYFMHWIRCLVYLM